MAVPTLLDYAYMAMASYGDDVNEVQEKFNACPNHGSWSIAAFMAGSPANGFQGAIFENDTDSEVVCAYKGSKGDIGDRTTTGYDDWNVNDVQIALNKIPNQTWKAMEFAEQARYIANGEKTLSLVGHSLGGGLAQLVGYVMGVPFVTFNAPGMNRNLPAPLSKPGRVPGFNMILWSDPVGNFGKHIGKTERFGAYLPLIPTTFGSGGRFAHVMKTVIFTLNHSQRWAAKTLNQLI
jgi:hypothetical protein